VIIYIALHYNKKLITDKSCVIIFFLLFFFFGGGGGRLQNRKFIGGIFRLNVDFLEIEEFSVAEQPTHSL
jgi:hypothetical protein